MQVTMLGIVRSNVLQLLFKSLVLVWSERMDSLDADTLHKQGSSADSVLLVYALVGMRHLAQFIEGILHTVIACAILGIGNGKAGYLSQFVVVLLLIEILIHILID